MFIGREKELCHLNRYGGKTGIKILIVYGQRGIGKTTLLRQFLQGKEYFYYEAISCSFKQQRMFMEEQMRDMEIPIVSEAGFCEIFEAIENSKRKIIVIDEFQNISRIENEFFQEMCRYFQKENREMFFIFCSSSVGWVENSLKKKLDEFCLSVDEFYKINELKYKEFKQYFTEFSEEDSIGAYSILGGIPGLWKYFTDKYSLRENIEKHILQKEAPLLTYGQQYVEEELRETAVYNTILMALADGKQKLNDLYLYTGFSRAKISVYLKNLIQLNFVEKVNIKVEKEHENAPKGFYEVSFSYLDFYYRYLFPNQNKIGIWKSEEIFEKKIETTFPTFVAKGFQKICCEFLESESAKGRLPEEFSYVGKWIGKTGKIDLIFKNEDGEILTGICNWEKDMMVYEDYSLFIEAQKSAKIISEYITLFSKGKFDNRLREVHRKNPYVALVSLEQMR